MGSHTNGIRALPWHSDGARLNESEFQAEQTAGTCITLEQAVEFAQHLPLKRQLPEQPGKSRMLYPSRECEIAALIALGKSNGEIADELVVSKRTIEKHIAHILKAGGHDSGPNRALGD